MNQFAVVLLEPEGYAHAGLVREVAETIHHGLLELGAGSALARNTMFSDRVNVVFAGHLLPAFQGWDANGTDNIVLFNLEPVREGLFDKLPRYLEAMQACRVWDYDARNAGKLAAMGLAVEHVPIGYASPMTRIVAAPEQDIDVLFYGSMNPRRLQLRDQLLALGLQARFEFGVYGESRDALIARAKVVVSPSRFDEGGVFDIVRLSYLLANRKAVVMESGVDETEEARFADAACFAPYPDLAEECAYLCAVESERTALEERGFSLFRSMPQCASLRPVIARLASRSS